MGVPKFYRWLSERYPKINQIISDLMLMPEFDNLYLDMNGIIHHCTHPNDDDLSAALSEKDVMLGIFNYIDRIVTQIAKPRKVLFMAIDGVAPRAKLNQQRSRRFASAKDREEARKAAEANGDFVDAASVFDSNCITPGTPFMARVSEHLRYFIRKKQKEDEVWRRLTIVFSGHEVPGEGEHKIMQYIREIRDDPNYDPNTAHCMYGQDADLIMLGLVSHEPHFTLLREVINFNQNRRNRRDPVNVTKTVVKQTARADFQLLHVSILREYLQIELCQDFYNASIPVNLERVIDDFVFMTFLVGNDFLPHLPSLDISEGAFDRLFGVYKEQAFRIVQSEGRPLSEAYLTMHGEVPNLGRLETFLAAIGAMEDTIFQERAKNEAEFAARRRKWDKRDGRASGPSEEELRLADQAKRAEFEAALQDLGQAVPGQQQQNRPQQGVSAAVARASAEFEYTKARYYFEKLGITPEHADVHGAIRQHYLEGLLWCLAYYYRGCVSWGWFYPFHYGPMMSDMVGLTDLGSKIRFEKGAPFLPFEQLLGCLPALSSQFLPKNYQFLMCDAKSPIADFYPADFKVDMNGKRNPWEGVNLLPFIDAARMRKTLAALCPPDSLTKEERDRNRFGDPIEYVYDASPAFEGVTFPSCNPGIGLPDLAHCRTRMRSRPDMLYDRTDVQFKAEIKPGCAVPFPGFPSMHVLPIPKAAMAPIKLNCFGSESRYSTFVLNLPEMQPEQLPETSALAASALGKSVFVNWPMLHEGMIVGVSDAKAEYTIAKEERAPPKDGNLDYKSMGVGRAQAAAAAASPAKSPEKGHGGLQHNDESQANTIYSSGEGGGSDGGGGGGAAGAGAGKPAIEVAKRAFNRDESAAWQYDSLDMRDEYLKGRGIPGGGGVDIGPVVVRLLVAPLQGMNVDVKTGAKTKVFGAASSDSVAEVPMQMAVWHDPAPDPRFFESGPKALKELVPLGTRVALLGNGGLGDKGKGKPVPKDVKARHGRVGMVVGHDETSGTVSVEAPVLPPEPPFGLGIASAVQDKYFPTGAIGKMLGIRPDILGRVLGSLIVDVDRDESFDLGLRLKIAESSGVKGERGAMLRVLGYIRHTGAQQFLNAKRQQQQGGRAGKQGGGGDDSAWQEGGDAVRVIGSKAKNARVGGAPLLALVGGGKGGGGGGGDGAPKMEGRWECSMRAIQLIQAYITQFPRLFQALNRTPQTDRFFKMDTLFAGADAAEKKAALTEVVDWLGGLEVMRLARAPLTTEALGSNAVKAIQKAADVRNAKLAQLAASGGPPGGDDSAVVGNESAGWPPLEVVAGVAPDELVLEPTPDTLRELKPNHNKGLPPVLGDRVLAVQDTAAPFGLRGTVIAVHYHSSTVEVVFDEPFVGGNALQGMCHKFRGRLLPWNHVLKLSDMLPSAMSATAGGADKKSKKAGAKQDPKAKGAKTTNNKGKKAAAKAEPEDDDDDEEIVVKSPNKAPKDRRSGGGGGGKGTTGGSVEELSALSSNVAALFVSLPPATKKTTATTAARKSPKSARSPVPQEALHRTFSDDAENYDEMADNDENDAANAANDDGDEFVWDDFGAAADETTEDVEAGKQLLAMLQGGGGGSSGGGGDGAEASMAWGKDGAALLAMLHGDAIGAGENDGGAGANLLSMLQEGGGGSGGEEEEEDGDEAGYEEAEEEEKAVEEKNEAKVETTAAPPVPVPVPPVPPAVAASGPNWQEHGLDERLAELLGISAMQDAYAAAAVPNAKPRFSKPKPRQQQPPRQQKSPNRQQQQQRGAGATADGGKGGTSAAAKKSGGAGEDAKPVDAPKIKLLVPAHVMRKKG